MHTFGMRITDQCFDVSVDAVWVGDRISRTVVLLMHGSQKGTLSSHNKVHKYRSESEIRPLLKAIRSWAKKTWQCSHVSLKVLCCRSSFVQDSFPSLDYLFLHEGKTSVRDGWQDNGFFFAYTVDDGVRKEGRVGLRKSTRSAAAPVRRRR